MNAPEISKSPVRTHFDQAKGPAQSSVNHAAQSGREAAAAARDGFDAAAEGGRGLFVAGKGVAANLGRKSQKAAANIGHGAQSAGAGALNGAFAVGRNARDAGGAILSKGWGLTKAIGSGATQGATGVFTERPNATTRGMIASFASAALCAAGVWGSVVFDQGIQLFGALCFHHLLALGAMYFLAKFLVQLLRRVVGGIRDGAAATNAQAPNGAVRAVNGAQDIKRTFEPASTGKLPSEARLVALETTTVSEIEAFETELAGLRADEQREKNSRIAELEAKLEKRNEFLVITRAARDVSKVGEKQAELQSVREELNTTKAQLKTVKTELKQYKQVEIDLSEVKQDLEVLQSNSNKVAADLDKAERNKKVVQGSTSASGREFKASNEDETSDADEEKAAGAQQ